MSVVWWDFSAGKECRWVMSLFGIDPFIYRESIQAVYSRNNNYSQFPYSEISAFLFHAIRTGGSFPAFRVKPDSYARTWAYAEAATNLAALRLPLAEPLRDTTGTHLGVRAGAAGRLPTSPGAAQHPQRSRCAGQPGGERLISSGVYSGRVRCCPCLRRERPPPCEHPRAPRSGALRSTVLKCRRPPAAGGPRSRSPGAEEPPIAISPV